MSSVSNIAAISSVRYHIFTKQHLEPKLVHYSDRVRFIFFLSNMMIKDHCSLVRTHCGYETCLHLWNKLQNNASIGLRLDIFWTVFLNSSWWLNLDGNIHIYFQCTFTSFCHIELLHYTQISCLSRKLFILLDFTYFLNINGKGFVSLHTFSPVFFLFLLMCSFKLQVTNHNKNTRGLERTKLFWLHLTSVSSAKFVICYFFLENSKWFTISMSHTESGDYFSTARDQISE